MVIAGYASDHGQLVRTEINFFIFFLFLYEAFFKFENLFHRESLQK